jgi:hypothetical protein
MGGRPALSMLAGTAAPVAGAYQTAQVLVNLRPFSEKTGVHAALIRIKTRRHENGEEPSIAVWKVLPAAEPLDKPVPVVVQRHGHRHRNGRQQ